MIRRLIVFLLASACLVGIASSQQHGYVVKRGEGERYFDGGMIVKASPRTGSQGAEMIWQFLAAGTATGRHVHHEADEFFYVIAGRGSAFVEGREMPIEAGDVVFVPHGEEHRLRSAGPDSSLEIVFLVDKPGLAEEVRASHARAEALGRDLTLEELNVIAERNGTTYYSLD